MSDWTTTLWLELSTQIALDKAGLNDVWVDAKRRILAHVPHNKDFRELVYLDLRDIARMPHLTIEDRRARIEWMLSLAGY